MESFKILRLQLTSISFLFPENFSFNCLRGNYTELICDMKFQKIPKSATH